MISVRIAAVLFGINGLGFGIPVLPAIRHLQRTGELFILFGFPTYGGGPFERRGIETTIPLLLAFLAVNVVQVVAGALLWTGAREGAILGLAILPIAAIFWWGFALPFGPPLAIVSVVLVLLNSSDLH